MQDTGQIETKPMKEKIFIKTIACITIIIIWYIQQISEAEHAHANWDVKTFEFNSIKINKISSLWKKLISRDFLMLKSYVKLSLDKQLYKWIFFVMYKISS